MHGFVLRTTLISFVPAIRYWSLRGGGITGLTPADAASNDNFGWSTALSGNGSVLIVGAIGWEGVGTDPGGVYTFDWNGSDWSQRGSVLAVGGANYDVFGSDVAISSNAGILVVGASGQNTSAGMVYTFDWNGSNWAIRSSANLKSIDGATSDNFGCSVALSANGGILVVGANGWEGSFSSQGAVYTYDWNGTSWAQRGSILEASDPAISDSFGISVALSDDGEILAVGAYGWEGGVSNQGGVYIFDRSGSSWVQRGSVLTANNAVSSDEFGAGVDLSSDGTILAVGAEGRDATFSQQGTVYFFEWGGSSWTQREQITTPDPGGDLFGYGVSLDGTGTIVAVGAYAWEGSLSNQGKVYTFDYA